jgi:mRNA deadenylase 3'-5' endonuclease subunit Ccr4
MVGQQLHHNRFLFLISALLTFVMKSQAQLPIRLITHNIRYATTSPFKGEKPWTDRKPLLLNELKYHTWNQPEAFVCLQEVLHQQLVDIMGGLGTTHRAPYFQAYQHLLWKGPGLK